MRPKKPETTEEGDLFRARLDQITNLKHELVQLGAKIDWDWIDREIAPLYSEKGRPGIASRFVIGLLLLKHIYGLSEASVSAGSMTRISSTSPALSFPARVPARALRSEPLAQAARRQVGAFVGREPAGRARDRCAADARPQAGDGGHYRPAQGRHLPDRRQARPAISMHHQSLGLNT
jgi:hypothetical protein